MDNKRFNSDFLGMDILSYHVFIRDLVMKELKAVFDLGKCVQSLVIDGKVFQLSRNAKYVHKSPRIRDENTENILLLFRHQYVSQNHLVLTKKTIIMIEVTNDLHA